MTEAIKNRIITDINAMTGLAEQYSAVTAEIITTDIDETLEDILNRRRDILESLSEKRHDIDSACRELTVQESDLIHKMIVGGHIPLGISKEMREIHKAAVRMHSVYLSVDEKAKQAAVRVDARLKELRSDLERVNEARRNAASYSPANTGFREAGTAFSGKM